MHGISKNNYAQYMTLVYSLNTLHEPIINNAAPDLNCWCCTPQNAIDPLGKSSKSLPQCFVNRKYEGRARRRSAHCDATPSIQPFQPMLSPQRRPHSPERAAPTCDSLDVLGLHTRLDRVCRVEDEIIAHTRHSASQHLVLHRRRVLGLRTPAPAEGSLHEFVAAEPCCRAAGLANQCAHLAVPEAEDAVVAVYGGYDCAGRGETLEACPAFQRNLHFAFD